jgi:hypothetical protein
MKGWARLIVGAGSFIATVLIVTQLYGQSTGCGWFAPTYPTAWAGWSCPACYATRTYTDGGCWGPGTTTEECDPVYVYLSEQGQCIFSVCQFVGFANPVNGHVTGTCATEH